MSNLSRIYGGWVEPLASPINLRNAGGARPRLDPTSVFYVFFQVRWSGGNEANRDAEQSRLAHPGSGPRRTPSPIIPDLVVLAIRRVPG